MTLNDRIASDLKDAMRHNDELRKTTLRLLRAALVKAEGDKRAVAVEAERKRRGGELGEAAVTLDEAALALTEPEALAVIQREVKQRRDAIGEYKKAKRPELAARERAELDVLQAYLPQQMGREEVEAAARAVITELGAKGPGQTGQVMKELMARLKGQAEGRVVNEVVRSLLSNQ